MDPRESSSPAGEVTLRALEGDQISVGRGRHTIVRASAVL
jgi:hypothetical protein